MSIKEIVQDLVHRSDEEEWFEFKENWFEIDELGEYVSALSNSAVICGKKEGYFVWGISDSEHKYIGTNINYNKSIKGEPLQNYLARNLYPSICFQFFEIEINKKRIVVLTIPAASRIPTSFKRVRYSRIGSSKVNLETNPEREALIWSVLENGYPTMINTESPIQDLSFNQLKAYYLSRNLAFNDRFLVNMHLLCDDKKYNMLACFLADNGDIPVRVSIFSGTSKSEPLYSVKEFGNCSLISAIDRIIDYSSSINVTRAIENLQTGIREDVPLFDQACFNEALKNAFIHNNWLHRVAPMVTFFSDKVEILSFSSLAPNQTLNGFYLGRSIPVNEELSSIFLATHLSERTGKGVPLIVSRYGKEAFAIDESSIKVTLKYYWVNNFVANVVDKAIDKVGDISLTKTESRIYNLLRRNPSLTQPQICEALSLGKTIVQKTISCLKFKGLIRREGSNKTGFWVVLK
jgi:ATP-dependent DNA helicase RecG